MQPTVSDGFVRSPYPTDRERARGMGWCAPAIAIPVIAFNLLALFAAAPTGEVLKTIGVFALPTLIALHVARRYHRSSKLPTAPFVLLFERHPLQRGAQRARLAWTEAPVREGALLRVTLLRSEELWSESDEAAYQQGRRRAVAAFKEQRRKKVFKGSTPRKRRTEDSTRVGETREHAHVVLELKGAAARDLTAPFELVVPPPAEPPPTYMTLSVDWTIRVDVEFADHAHLPAHETWEVDVSGGNVSGALNAS